LRGEKNGRALKTSKKGKGGHRFISIRAFSELTCFSSVTGPACTAPANYFSSGPWASIGELGAVDCDGNDIPKTNWSIYYRSSEETGFEAALAIDDDPATFWHSQYTGTLAQPPHEIQIDLGADYELLEVTYQARATNPAASTDFDQWTSGMIWTYEILVSKDGDEFISVATGQFDPDLSNRGQQCVETGTSCPDRI
jgi:hypothetical protein